MQYKIESGTLYLNSITKELHIICPYCEFDRPEKMIPRYYEDFYQCPDCKRYYTLGGDDDESSPDGEAS